VAAVGGIPYVRAATKPHFFLGMAKLFTKAFPDRFGLFVCKMTPVMAFIMRVVKPILPASVATKMVFPTNFNAHVKDLVGEDLTPEWCGGKAIHPERVRTNFAEMMAGVKGAMRNAD